MKKLAVVTGGAGFIGSHLVDRLIREKWSVVVIDDLSTGFVRNLNPEADFKKLDIRKPQASACIRKLKPQVVFHLAAQASVPVSVKDPIGDAETNLHATLHLLDAAADAKVKRFIFAGTGGALSSEKTQLPTDEAHASEPTSPYAIAKVASERYGAFYRLSRGLPFVALRLANVYGPRQNPNGEAGVIAVFSKRMLKGESVKVNGTGKQTRDYVYVADVVDAMMAALYAKGVSASGGEVPKAEGPYHVGNGVEVSVNDLFKRIAKLTEYKKKPLKGPADVGAPSRSSLDSSKIRKELDWAATTSLEEGLWLTVDWFRSNA